MIFQFGTVTNPLCRLISSTSPLCVDNPTAPGLGLVLILGNLIKMSIVLAGIYTLWNLITAGFLFLNATGDAKQVTRAWDKIWQSLVGLLIIAGSFVLAAVMGFLIFGDPTMLLQFRVIGPTT